MEEFKEIEKLKLIMNYYVSVCDMIYILVALTHCLFCSSFVLLRAAVGRDRGLLFVFILIGGRSRKTLRNILYMYLIMYILNLNDVGTVKCKYNHAFYIYDSYMYTLH